MIVRFNHSEPNEFPADVLTHGTFAAEWTGFYLRLTKCDTRVPLGVSFPGVVSCTATVSTSTISVVIELAS